MTSEPTLERALVALAPYFPRLVIIGGTAHRLFPQHPLGSIPKHALLTTEDVDIAAPLELSSDTSRTLLDSLRDAGFDEQVRGAVDPEYVYVRRSAPVEYLQFLAPLHGSGEKRDGSPDVRLKIGGVSAKRLRAIDLLLHEPWTVRLTADDLETDVPVTNPMTYVVQKLLKLGERHGNKRGRDILYLFDTLTIFADELRTLAASAHTLLPILTPKQRQRVRANATEHCFVVSDGVRNAARIADGQRRHPPNTNQIAQGCRQGLMTLLSDLVARPDGTA